MTFAPVDPQPGTSLSDIFGQGPVTGMGSQPSGQTNFINNIFNQLGELLNMAKNEFEDFMNKGGLAGIFGANADPVLTQLSHRPNPDGPAPQRGLDIPVIRN